MKSSAGNNIIEFEKIKERIAEECRLNLVKAIVDCACTVAKTGVLDKGARAVFRPWVKEKVMTFLPGQELRYDMIYDSRIKRCLEESSR